MVDAAAEAIALFLRHFAANLGGDTHRDHSGGHFHAFGNQSARRNDSSAADMGVIQYCGSDADQAFVFNDAAMQNNSMAHRHAIADRERKSDVGVQHAIILNTHLVAHANRSRIAAQSSARPNARTLANNDVANDLGRLAYRMGMKEVAEQLFRRFPRIIRDVARLRKSQYPDSTKKVMIYAVDADGRSTFVESI